ncbi:g1323 [Coccomyxa elongata]
MDILELQDAHFQFGSDRQLSSRALLWRRHGTWRRVLTTSRRSGPFFRIWPLPKALRQCRSRRQGVGLQGAAGDDVSTGTRAGVGGQGDPNLQKGPTAVGKGRGSFAANDSDDIRFNNAQGAGGSSKIPVRPGEVYETPKRGPGFTDVPQPVRRFRQQREVPMNPGDEKKTPHKQSLLFQQIDVNIMVTVADEETAVREKGYWVQLLQKGGLLDVGNERPRVRRDLSDQMRSHGSPFRSGYLVNRLLSQISNWQTVFTVLRDLEPLFDHINVSTAMHRLAKVSVRNKVPPAVVMAHPLYPHLLQILKKKIRGKMRPRQLANTFWALAKLGHDAEDVVDALLEQLQETQIETWQEQEISNVVWAMATLSRSDDQLLETMARDALRRGMNAFVPQAISNMVWGFAVLEYSNIPFMLAVAEHFVEDLSYYATQAVSNILWGCAVLNFYDQDMFNAAALEIQHRIHSFNDQEISNCLLAFAKMEHVDVNVLRVFEEDIARPERVRDFTSQALSNMAWSFATLRWYPEKVLEAISGELHRRNNKLTVQELSVSIWAMAKLGYHPGRSLADFGRRIEELVPDFNSQACANTLWGLSVLQATQLPCFQMLIDRLGSGETDKVEVLMLHQLFQSLMLARLEARRNNAADPIRSVPDHIYTLIRRVWKETVKNTLSSRFHMDVSQMLRDMGVAHDFEYVTEDGLFSLDIATAGPRGPVAIEVDGPYHFTLNTRQPLGSTLIRRRLLHALGWTVLSVPFYDYYRLGSAAAKMHYLAQLLQKVDIEVEMDKALQEQAEQAAAAAAAESLGSLELPQGRPSPSDGPTRQDDIAGPLFPARPPTAKKYERPRAAARMAEGAERASVSPRSPTAVPLSGRRPGVGSLRSQGPVARNPLSQQRTRAISAVAQWQPQASTPHQPASAAEAATANGGMQPIEQTEVRPASTAEAARANGATQTMEQPEVCSGPGEGSGRSSNGAWHRANSGHSSEAVNGSVSVQQEGTVCESENVLREWRARRGAELEAQLLKTELHPLCRKYGLPITGRKETIVQRLLNYEAVHRTG